MKKTYWTIVEPNGMPRMYPLCGSRRLYERAWEARDSVPNWAWHKGQGSRCVKVTIHMAARAS